MYRILDGSRFQLHTAPRIVGVRQYSNLPGVFDHLQMPVGTAPVEVILV